jgi:hypothetical protein
VADEMEAFEAESVGEDEKIVAEGGFLTAYEVVAEDRGWAVAAKVGHDEAQVGGVEPVVTEPQAMGLSGKP